MRPQEVAVIRGPCRALSQMQPLAGDRSGQLMDPAGIAFWHTAFTKGAAYLGALHDGSSL
jgi:hypothetical protein